MKELKGMYERNLKIDGDHWRLPEDVMCHISCPITSQKMEKKKKKKKKKKKNVFVILRITTNLKDDTVAWKNRKRMMNLLWGQTDADGQTQYSCWKMTSEKE